MTTTDKTIPERKKPAKTPPHIPNAKTRKAIEDGLAEKLNPVTRADIRKMWEDA